MNNVAPHIPCLRPCTVYAPDPAGTPGNCRSAAGVPPVAAPAAGEPKPHNAPRNVRTSAGQAVVLLLALLVAMAAMVLWLLDTHTAVLARLRAQDAGDPTALAAARWQAAGLNLCGELNLIHAYMLADDVRNAPDAEALHALQQRISVAVPLLSLQAAQTLAVRNKAEVLPEARELLLDCARWVRFPDFYEGATEDFITGLQAILSNQELCVFPVAPIFSSGDSLLGNQDFYEAVLAEDYCWFWFYAYSFLETYRRPSDFGQVPEIATSIFFDLGLKTQTYALNDLRTRPMQEEDGRTVTEQMDEQLQTLGHPALPALPPPAHNGQQDPFAIAREESALSHPWMVYGPAWHPWEAMHKHRLPLRAPVKDAYDTLGAYCAVSVTRSGYPWFAGAKPFGEVAGEPPRENTPLLGGFDAVRLVPVDALDAGLRPFDAQWLRHLYFHVREFHRKGHTVDGCRYCSALRKWENAAFRATASAWLSLHGHTCRRPKPGRGDTGGARYAH